MKQLKKSTTHGFTPKIEYTKAKNAGKPGAQNVSPLSNPSIMPNAIF
ncbi:hypothetical protein MASR2M39_32590 [Ignavibacteriales bacterium]